MRQIINLKFLGHPMVKCDYGFWVYFQKIGLRVQIHEKNLPFKPVAFVVISLRAKTIHNDSSFKGALALRNKAERWFRKWAADVGEVAKGKP